MSTVPFLRWYQAKLCNIFFGNITVKVTELFEQLIPRLTLKHSNIVLFHLISLQLSLLPQPSQQVG